MARPRRIKSEKEKPKPDRIRVDADVLPRRSLEQVVPIAQALHETYAGKSASAKELADHLEVGATTNNWKYMLWAAQAYGIVQKAEDNQFSLGEVGRKIVAPQYTGEDAEGRIKAVLTPTLLSRFFSDYNNHTIPSEAHLPNVLENRYALPRNRVSEAIDIILPNGRYAGILQDIPGSDQPIVRLSGISGTDSQLPRDELKSADIATEQQITAAALAHQDWTKICFFITPIGDEGTEVRKHADMLLKHLVEPALKDFQIRVIRADKIEKSGLISQQIFEHLVRARLCIADLSFSNPNAFYELGIRHLCKLPTIQIIRKGDRIPFDVSQGRTITVDTSDVYTVMDRVDSARRELGEHAKNILEGKGEIGDDNPVHYYLPTLKVTLPD